jgi:hypothetical protein
MQQETKNLMQGLCEEIDRVKEIVKEYEATPGGAGNFAALFMKQDISMAEKARNEGDAIQMIACFHNLKDYEL